MVSKEQIKKNKEYFKSREIILKIYYVYSAPLPDNEKQKWAPVMSEKKSYIKDYEFLFEFHALRYAYEKPNYEPLNLNTKVQHFDNPQKASLYWKA